MKNYNQLSGDDLFVFIQQGDEKAFAIFYGLFHRYVFTVAYDKLHDVEDAKEVTLDVFIDFRLKAHTFRLQTPVKNYLVGMVANKCATAIEKRKKRKKHENGYGRLSDSFSEFQPLENHELGLQLAYAISRLPIARRNAFVLAYIEDKSVKEIAIIMKIQDQSVRNHISRALQDLRKALKNIF